MPFDQRSSLVSIPSVSCMPFDQKYSFDSIITGCRFLFVLESKWFVDRRKLL